MKEYFAPIHQSLVSKILIAGVPRELAILNGTLTASIVLGLHSVWGIPLGVLVHGVCVAITRHDEEFLGTVRRQIKQKRYYDA